VRLQVRVLQDAPRPRRVRARLLERAVRRRHAGLRRARRALAPRVLRRRRPALGQLQGAAPRVRARVRAPRRSGAGLREPLSDANAAFGREAFAAIAANSDWSGRAWILAAATGAGEESNPPAEVAHYREKTNEASFDATAAAASWIVVSLVQDGGWSATLERTGAGAPKDAEPLALSRANGPFLALRVPAGTHRVRLRYRPPGWIAGLWIGAATCLTLVAYLALRSGRPRLVRR
jgi:hypothetical protein